MSVTGSFCIINGLLGYLQENSNGNDTGYMGQNYDEGASTSSKFRSKLRDLRRR